MSGADDVGQGPRVPPDGHAWRDAQRELTERNDQASKASREKQAEHQRHIAELKRTAQRDKGHTIYR